MADLKLSIARQKRAEQSQPGSAAEMALRLGTLNQKYSDLVQRLNYSNEDNAQLKRDLESLRRTQTQVDNLRIENSDIRNNERSWQTKYSELLPRLNKCELENARITRQLASSVDSHTTDSDLLAENNELRHRIANWTSFHSQREAQLAAREARLSKSENKAPIPVAKKQKLDPTDLNISTFMQEEILAWMFSETLPDDLQVSKGYLHIMGDGPWDNDTFGRLMEEQDFSLWKLPDADIAHIVVGRKNWKEAELIAQIEARHGQELRIYSQEMWFAAMATGRDPFDAEAPELLQAFANGHEALEFLIDQEMPWPNVADHPPGNVTDVEVGELGVVASPMHLMDYRVGKTSPHSEVERRAILDEIYCSRNLPFGDDCSPTYRSNWGTPKSAQRLYRMASHIKFIVDGPNGSDYRKSVAREDWINDLAWLKKTYFRKTVHNFQWPSTHVP